MLDRVLRLPAVASKRYLTNKVVNKLEGMKTSTGDSVRVFNMSRWLAKFAGYFTWTRHLLSFGNNPSFKRVFMYWHWKNKSKFNNVCVLSKHSNFCSRLLKMHSKRPRFQNFSRNSFTPSVLASHAVTTRFSFSTYSKAFATYFKSYWKPCNVLSSILFHFADFSRKYFISKVITLVTVIQHI